MSKRKNNKRTFMKLDNKPVNTNNSKVAVEDKNHPKMRRNVISTEAHFSGPLPPPGILNGYCQIDSTFGDRIITMAEKQSQHRMNLEEKVVSAGIIESKLGLLVGFILGLTLILGSVFLIWSGKQVSGFLMLIPGIGAIAFGYKKGVSQHTSQMEEKKDI